MIDNTMRGAKVMNEFVKYRTEAREKWGRTDAYREYAEKTRDYSGQKWIDLAQFICEAIGIYSRS